MSSNYPPGVTGNEFEIAGPDYERESDVRCIECDGPTMAYGYRCDHWLICQWCECIMDDPDIPEPDPEETR